MQVNHQIIHQQTTMPNAPLELKQGEVYRATIKEKINDNDAILNIRGKEVHARFSEGVPTSENRVAIQVNGQSDNLVNVKTITTENTKTASNEEKIFTSLGITGKESSHVKQAVSLLLDKGAPLSREIVGELKEFMEKAPGTLDAKLETVRALANKRLEATGTQLLAVHEALHGKPLNEVLSSIAKEIDPDFKLEKTEMASIKSQNQKDSVPASKATETQPVIENHTSNNRTEGMKLSQNTQNPAKTNASEQSNLVRKSLELLESEPDLKKAIKQIREEIVKNPKIDRDLTQKIEKAAQEAEKLQSIGKERLVQVLKGAEEQLLKKEQQSIQTNVTKNQTKETVTNRNQVLKLSTLVENIKLEVTKNPSLNRSIEKINEQIIENPRFPKEITEKVNRALNEASSLGKQGRITTGKEVLSKILTDVQNTVDQIDGKISQQANAEQSKAIPRVQNDRSLTESRPSEIIKSVKAEVQNEPNLQKAVEKVREQVVVNPKMDREVAQKVEQVLKETVQLQKVGQEPAGRDRLQQALVKAEVGLKQIESRQLTQPTKVSQSDRVPTEPRPSEVVKQVRVEVQNEPNLQKAVEKVREQVVAHPKMDREVAQKVEQALKEATQPQQIGRESTGRERLNQALAKAEVELKQIETRQPTQATQTDQETIESRPSEVVKQVKVEVQSEPNLQRAVEKVREQVVANPKMDREVAQKVEQSLKEAIQLQKIGQEPAGRDRVQQALAKAEVELKQIETRQPTQATQTDQETIESRPSEVVKQVKAEVQSEPNLQRVVEKVRDQVVANPKIDREVAQKVEQSLKEAIQLQKTGQEPAGRDRVQQALAKAELELKQIETQQPTQATQTNLDKTEPRSSEVVKQVKAEVQREPNLQRAVEKVREQVVANPKMDREVAQKVEQALKEAVQLQQIGRESTGRERLNQALAKAEIELKQIETRQPAQAIQASQTDLDTAESRPSEVVKQVKAEVQSEPNLQRAVEKVREQVVTNPKMDREVAQKVEQALKEATLLQKIGQEPAGRDRLQQALAKAEVELKQIESRQPVQVTQTDQDTVESRPSEVVKQVKAEVQSEPNLQRAVEKVREQVVSNPKMDREVAQKVEQALKEATQLQRVGRESTGRDRVQQALAKAEVELKQIETRQPAQASQVTQTDQDTVGSLSSEVVKKVKAEVQSEPNLQRAVEKVHEQVVANPKVDREVAQKVEQALKEATQLQQVGRESIGRDRVQQALAKAEVELKKIETRQPTQANQVIQTDQDTVDSRPSQVVKQVKAEVQSEPNLQRAVEKVREQVVSNPKMDREVSQKVEQGLNATVQLQKIGQEPAGRAHLQQVLTKAEVELKQIESHQTSQQSAQQSQNSQLRESIKQVREQIQTEPDIQRILQKVQDIVTNNKNVDPETTRNIERIANQANQLDQAGRERLTKMLQQVETTLSNQNQMQQKEQPIINNLQQQISSMKNQEMAEQPKTNGIRPSESINQALKQLQREPNLEKALDQVRKEITSNPNIDLKIIAKAEKALNQATQLQDKGREIAARQHITKELTEVQQELAKTEPKLNTEQKSLQEQIQYELNEQLQGLNIQSKDILVTKVTEKLAQVTHDFRELKREITRNLDSVERVINTFKKNAYPQAKQMLETAISKLDNAILKSDMMLFTDMKTEKQLMNASSQLAEAKKLLAKGDHTEAGKIVNEVKTLVDKLIFKPSEQKIMHYVNKESTLLGNSTPKQQMLSQFSEATHGTVNQEPSARQMYEMVRSLGLNHESDVANSLVFHKNDQFGQSQQEQQQQQQNLKEVLMKLTQGDGQETNPKIVQQAEQALTNLTGQQLLSKSDANGALQSMFFNLPLMLGGKPENLQVFINSKNEGQQVEWENCNLYFLLETKKLGDVGILLNSTDRNLSITIKNDLPGFKEKIEPLASFTKEKLQEVGYNVSSINFARMNPVRSQTISHEELGNEMRQVKETRQIFNEKGMDFTI